MQFIIINSYSIIRHHDWKWYIPRLHKSGINHVELIRLSDHRSNRLREVFANIAHFFAACILHAHKAHLAFVRVVQIRIDDIAVLTNLDTREFRNIQDAGVVFIIRRMLFVRFRKREQLRQREALELLNVLYSFR